MGIGASTFDYRRPSTRRLAPQPLSYSDRLRKAGGTQVGQAPQAEGPSLSPPADDTGYNQGYNPGGGTGGQGPLPDIPSLPPVNRRRKDPDIYGGGGDQGGGGNDDGTTIIINTGGGSGRKDRPGTGRGRDTITPTVGGATDPYVPPGLPPEHRPDIPGTVGPAMPDFQAVLNQALRSAGIIGAGQNWQYSPENTRIREGRAPIYQGLMTGQQGNELLAAMRNSGYGAQLAELFGANPNASPGTGGLSPSERAQAAVAQRRQQIALQQWLMRLGTTPTGFELPPTYTPGTPPSLI